MASALTSLPPAELAMYPAAAPPPRVLSDFDNSAPNQTVAFLAVTSLLLGIMSLFVLNRLYAKQFLIRKHTWDDLTITLGVIGSVTYYVACVWGAQRGRIGYHLWDINLIQIQSLDLLIPSYLIAIFTPPTMLFLKTTFFILYLQLFKPMRWLRINAYIGIAFTTVFYIGMTVAQFVFATPRANETWFSHQSTPREQLALAMSVPQSCVGLAIDVYILVLPIIAVSKLQMATRIKIGIMLLFATGLMACIASALSIYYRYILSHSPDLTWNLMPVNTATLTEMFVGVICACMPSAAHSCREHVPPYATFKSLLYSRFSTLNSILGGASRHSRQNSTDDHVPLDDKLHGTYSNLDHSWNPKRTNMSQKDGAMRTYIKGDSQNAAVGNGIHVGYKVEHNFNNV